MRNNNYGIIDNEGGGECLFAVIRDGLSKIDRKISVAELRQRISDEATEEVFSNYKYRYDMFMETYRILSAELKDLVKKNREMKESIKNITIWEAPKVLIIHLKRFKKTLYGSVEKITNKVNFPLNGLDISDYLHKSSSCKNKIYDLFAINNHTNFNRLGFNSISFGHYYSYCKNFMNNKWYDYNDDTVNEIKENKIITADAYILFYRLRE